MNTIHIKSYIQKIVKKSMQNEGRSMYLQGNKN